MDPKNRFAFFELVRSDEEHTNHFPRKDSAESVKYLPCWSHYLPGLKFKIEWTQKIGSRSLSWSKAWRRVNSLSFSINILIADRKAAPICLGGSCIISFGPRSTGCVASAFSFE